MIDSPTPTLRPRPRRAQPPRRPQGGRRRPRNARPRPGRARPDAQVRRHASSPPRTTRRPASTRSWCPAFSRSRRSPLTYSQLVRFDENMAIQPELAESWTLSDDKLTWTFKLRQGVKFHDGQELTSDDVKFTFDRLLEKSAGGKADFTALDKVEPAGKYQVKFVTKEPFAALLAALGGFWAYIVSEAGVKARAAATSTRRDGNRPLHAGRLEGRAADGLQEEPELLQEGAALRRRGRDPDHPGRGEHRRGPPRRADPPRLHRGQQELEPPEGREGPHRLPVVAPRLRLPQHQREPRQPPADKPGRSRTSASARPSATPSTGARSCGSPPPGSGG